MIGNGIDESSGYADDFDEQSDIVANNSEFSPERKSVSNQESGDDNMAYAKKSPSASALPSFSIETEKPTIVPVSPSPFVNTALGSSLKKLSPKSAANTGDALTRRDRLEMCLVTLHDMDKKVTVKRYTSPGSRLNEKPTEHFVLLADGVTHKPCDPFGFTLLHHRESDARRSGWDSVEKNVRDYRDFRPTSPDRKMHPTKSRGDPFLLPGQKGDVGKDFHPKIFLDMLHTARQDCIKKIETNDSYWFTRLHKILDKKISDLRKVQKEEINKLYDEFNSYKDNRVFADTAVCEADRENPRLNSHIIPTLEQSDYVEKHLQVQRDNNHNRREILTSIVRNRQNDEIFTLKNTMRSPLEMLKRTTDSAREVVDTATNKVLRALQHVEKTISRTSTHVAPAVRLRTQRTEQQQLIIVRAALHTLNDLFNSLAGLYDSAFVDFCSDAQFRFQEETAKSLPQALRRSRSPCSPKQSRSSSPDTGPDMLNTFKNVGSCKPDSLSMRTHSGVHTREHHIRTVNGYKYRTRSPPRGTQIKEVEVPDTRPRPSSYLRGKIIRGQHDILNTKNSIPYNARQFGRGREGMEQAVLPGLLTSKRLLAWAATIQRPATAPGGINYESLSATTTSKTTSERAKLSRPKTATSPGLSKRDKLRPKSSAPASPSGNCWDPNSFPVDYEEDDDASVGIVQDTDIELNVPSFDDMMKKEDAIDQKHRHRLFLETKSEEELLLEHSKYSVKKLARHKKAVRQNRRKPGEVYCDDCGNIFDSKDTIFIPKIGVSPELQRSFREKQAAAQRKLLRTNSAKLTAAEKHVGKLVQKEQNVKKNYGVPAPESRKQFCSWPCCKRYALRNCHVNNIFDMETIIHLTAGRIIEDDE